MDESINAVATTTGGANTWKPELARELVGKTVVVLPDNDEAGERYCRDVTESLETEGIPYKVVSFKGTESKDVSDYLETHNFKDFARLVGEPLAHDKDAEPVFLCDSEEEDVNI